jgi:hypothetical protein
MRKSTCFCRGTMGTCVYVIIEQTVTSPLFLVLFCQEAYQICDLSSSSSLFCTASCTDVSSSESRICSRTLLSQRVRTNLLRTIGSGSSFAKEALIVGSLSHTNAMRLAAPHRALYATSINSFLPISARTPRIAVSGSMLLQFPSRSNIPIPQRTMGTCVYVIIEQTVTSPMFCFPVLTTDRITDKSLMQHHQFLLPYPTYLLCAHRQYHCNSRMSFPTIYYHHRNAAERILGISHLCVYISHTCISGQRNIL